MARHTLQQKGCRQIDTYIHRCYPFVYLHVRHINIPRGRSRPSSVRCAEGCAPVCVGSVESLLEERRGDGRLGIQINPSSALKPHTHDTYSQITHRSAAKCLWRPRSGSSASHLLFSPIPARMVMVMVLMMAARWRLRRGRRLLIDCCGHESSIGQRDRDRHRHLQLTTSAQTSNTDRHTQTYPPGGRAT